MNAPADPSAAQRRWAPSPAPAGATAAGRSVSFEFAPPKTPEAEEGSVAGDPPAGAAVARLRLGDLWRRRLDPRAHPPHGAADAERDDPVARRPPDLRRRLPRGGGRGDPGLLGRRHPPHRRPARRSAGPDRRRPMFRAPTATPTPPSSPPASAAIAPFEVSVGLYPQIHPESPSVAHDIDVLKAKIDAGATRAITQFFFDIDGFLRFTDQVAQGGGHHPDLRRASCR